MEIANKESWKTEPMPSQHSVLAYTAAFSAEEYERIARGLIPREMEDNRHRFSRKNRGRAVVVAVLEKEPLIGAGSASARTPQGVA